MLRASVIGNIGGEPEMRYSAGGTAFLRFSVASNGRTRTPDGEWKDETTWVRATVFGQRAESLSNLLHKGMRVYVEGRLEARPWTSQQGQLNAGLELAATDVEFMSPRTEDGQQARPVASGNRGGTVDDGDVPF